MARWQSALAVVWFVASCTGENSEGELDAAVAVEADAAAGNEHRPPGVALCYSALADAHPATAAFWTAFGGGVLEDRAAAITALADATKEFPEEEELALLSGLANLWRVAEPLPDQVDDMAGLGAAALTARSELERAYALCPTDHRIPAWLGPVLVNTGRAFGDQATIDEGLAVLQQGIEHYPSFVLFSKLLIYADRPKDDPDFQNALDALNENTAVCSPSDPACSNHARAVHNVEGASVFLGDVLTKAGEKQRALDTYAYAKDAAEYGEWDYQELLEARITDLDARSASYDNDDPSDDADAIWTSDQQCSVCHRH